MKTSLFLVGQIIATAVNHYRTLQVPSLHVPSSICEKDESIEAKCALDSEPAAYEKSKSVLRITRSGAPHCTAWFIGDQGHILTNNHCASSSSSGRSLKFEAMAEGAKCETDCQRSLACKGIQIHKMQLDFIATGGNTSADWTLFQLQETEIKSAMEQFGYLKIRKSGSIEGERIYIAGHPRGYGKRISFMDGQEFGTVLNRNFDTGCGKSELIYRLDTQGGHSGSPVIAYSDNNVVGLHHCGDCIESGNSAVDVDVIYESLKDILPESAWA